jgi:hypothetical protein
MKDFRGRSFSSDIKYQENLGFSPCGDSFFRSEVFMRQLLDPFQAMSFWRERLRTKRYSPWAYISQPRYRVAASWTIGATVEKFAATWCSKPFSQM